LIVPDGRTDPEKLRELLGNPEETHIDLKAKVDLTDNEDKLKFVKTRSLCRTALQAGTS